MNGIGSTGNETKRLLLALGAACSIVAFATGTAVIWSDLGRSGQVALMVAVTSALLVTAVRLRRLPSTADALAAIGLAGAAIDATAARTLGLELAAGGATHVYVAVAAAFVGALATAVAVLRSDLTAPRVVGALASYAAATAVVDPTTAARGAALGPIAVVVAVVLDRIFRSAVAAPARGVSAVTGATLVLVGAVNAAWAAWTHQPAALFGAVLVAMLLVLPEVVEEQERISGAAGAAAGGIAAVLGIAAASDVDAVSRAMATLISAIVVVLALVPMSPPAPLQRLRVALVSAGTFVAAVSYLSLVLDTSTFAGVNAGLAGVALCALVLLPMRWISGLAAGAFASVATDLALQLHGVSVPEAYVAVPALVGISCGVIAMRCYQSLPSTVLLPGMLVGLLPTLSAALDGDVQRQIAVLFVAGAFVAVGAQLRWVTPMAVGASAITLVLVRIVGPQMVHVPRWLAFAVLGAVLLALGATWEARIADAQRISQRLRPRIAALR